MIKLILRILTDTNFFDIETKEPIDKELLIKAIDNGDAIMLETKDNTTVFINNINVVAIEIFNTPPISIEK